MGRQEFKGVCVEHTSLFFNFFSALAYRRGVIPSTWRPTNWFLGMCVMLRCDHHSTMRVLDIWLSLVSPSSMNLLSRGFLHSSPTVPYVSSLGFLTKEIQLTPRLLNTKERCRITYIRSNDHKFFVILSQSVMNQALKFGPLAVFGLVQMMAESHKS